MQLQNVISSNLKNEAINLSVNQNNFEIIDQIPYVTNDVNSFYKILEPLSSYGFLKLFSADPLVCFPTLHAVDSRMLHRNEYTLPFYSVSISDNSYITDNLNDKEMMDHYHFDISYNLRLQSYLLKKLNEKLFENVDNESLSLLMKLLRNII